MRPKAAGNWEMKTGIQAMDTDFVSKFEIDLKSSYNYLGIEMATRS